VIRGKELAEERTAEMTDGSESPFYGIEDGEGPAYLTLGSGQQVPVETCPPHLRDAVDGMLQELRKLFDADPVAFDAAFRWVAYQAGLQDPEP
jgi:hypothetical protein